MGGIYEYIYGFTVEVTGREINIRDQILTIKENVKTIYEKTFTPFGNYRKVNVSKKYIGKRVMLYF